VGFAVGSVPYAAYYVVTRTFYAMHDTRTPVRVGICMIALNAAADLVLMQWLGHTGIALATSLVAFANVGWLLAILRRRLGRFDGAAILGTGVRTVLAGAVLALVSLGTLQAAGRVVNPARFSGAALQLATALAAGAVAYLGACALLGVQELALLGALLRRGPAARYAGRRGGARGPARAAAAAAGRRAPARARRGRRRARAGARRAGGAAGRGGRAPQRPRRPPGVRRVLRRALRRQGGLQR